MPHPKIRTPNLKHQKLKTQPPKPNTQIEQTLSPPKSEPHIRTSQPPYPISDSNPMPNPIQVPCAQRVPSDWVKVSSTRSRNRYHPPQVLAAVDRLTLAKEEHSGEKNRGAETCPPPPPALLFTCSGLLHFWEFLPLLF